MPLLFFCCKCFFLEIIWFFFSGLFPLSSIEHTFWQRTSSSRHPNWTTPSYVYPHCFQQKAEDRCCPFCTVVGVLFSRHFVHAFSSAFPFFWFSIMVMLLLRPSTFGTGIGWKVPEDVSINIDRDTNHPKNYMQAKKNGICQKKWHFSGPLKPRKKFGASPMGYFPRGGGVQESVLWSRPH